MKNIFLNTIVGLLIASQLSFGVDTVFNTDKLKFGKKAAGTKTLEFENNAGAANPKIKWSNSDAQLQFSNNGVDFSALGSGSGAGGGLNVLDNPDFESGITAGWTSSGGTFAEVTSGTNLLFGAKSATFTASSSGQYFESTSKVIPVGLQSKNCLVRVFYKGGSTALKMRALTSGGSLIAEKALVASTDVSVYPLNFICPASGSMKIRIESTGSSAIAAFDRMYLGEADNVSQLSQATYAGGATWPGAAGCTWTGTTGMSFINYAAEASCTFPAGSNLRGGASAPATKVPGVTFANLEPGHYYMVAYGSFLKAGNIQGGSVGFRISDGTNFGTAHEVSNSHNSAGFGINHSTSTIMAEFNYTTPQTNLTFQVQNRSVDGSSVGYVGADNGDLTFALFKYPTNTSLAFKPDQVAWRVDTSIGGSNPDLLTGNQTDKPIENGALVMVQNSGSIAAQIPCSSTNPSTGLTCAAGNEQLGVVFNMPSPGVVTACASFAHLLAIGAGGAVTDQFKWVETPNTNDATITTDSTYSLGSSNQGISGITTTYPVTLCKDFSFTSSGQKTLRLFYSQAATGTITVNQVIASTLEGNNGVNITVTPKVNYVGQPLLVNTVVSPSNGVEKITRATITNNGSTCSVVTTSGSWISSVTRGTAGVCDIAFVANTFSTAPTCTTSMNNGSGSNTPTIKFENPPTTSGVTVVTGNAGSDTDKGFSIICMGPQ